MKWLNPQRNCGLFFKIKQTLERKSRFSILHPHFAVKQEQRSDFGSDVSVREEANHSHFFEGRS